MHVKYRLRNGSNFVQGEMPLMNAVRYILSDMIHESLCITKKLPWAMRASSVEGYWHI